MFYHYNENFKDTFVDDQAAKGLDYKLQTKVGKVFEYYFKHFQGLTDDNKIYLLSGNKKAYTEILKDFLPTSQIQKYVIDLNDFIAMNQEIYPELTNFMGFEEEMEEDTFTEVDPSKRIYEDHLTFDQMVLGVKQG